MTNVLVYFRRVITSVSDEACWCRTSHSIKHTIELITNKHGQILIKVELLKEEINYARPNSNQREYCMGVKKLTKNWLN